MNIFVKLRSGVTTNTPEATIELAVALAPHLPDQAVLALEGDLGAGKTTFVKGLARAWGIAATVASPTFTIYQIYHGARCLAHMDAYRLEASPGIWEELLLEELLSPPFCLAIEWPSKLSSFPWPITHRLRFEDLRTGRRITLESEPAN